jgi:hypothetical protein
MLLKEILTRLCEGEFSTLNYGYLVDGSPLDENYAKLVRHVDMGLLELHKRFPLRVREVFIQQYEQISTYYLDSRYAETNTESAEPIKYIIDTAYSVFNDSDFLCIDTLYDEVGERVPLNDLMEATSMFTPSFNSIQVMSPQNTNMFSAHYRASHGNLPTDLPSDEVIVAFPYSHLEALLYYTASRGMAGVDTEGSNNYYLKFEASCKKLSELKLDNTDNTRSVRFEMGGWV